MEPIVLTRFDETLNPYSGIDKHGITDETILYASCWGERPYDKDIIGVHDICNGTIQLKKVSRTHNALCCNQCNLRIVIPIEVDNYRKLRVWFESDLPEDKKINAFKTLEYFKKMGEIEIPLKEGSSLTEEEEKQIAKIAKEVKKRVR